MHHHHLQPPTDVYHAPKPLIPSSSSTILGNGLGQPLTPGLYTPTEIGSGVGMNGSSFTTDASKSTPNPNSTSNSSSSAEQPQTQQTDSQSKSPVTPVTTTSAAAAAAVSNESSRTLCVRHQSMADQGINGKLQQVSHCVVTTHVRMYASNKLNVLFFAASASRSFGPRSCWLRPRSRLRSSSPSDRKSVV